MLNRSKGPAVYASHALASPAPPTLTVRVHLQGPRAQIDRKLYKKHMQAALRDYPNLDIRTASVKDIVLGPPPSPSTSDALVKNSIVGVRISALLGALDNTLEADSD